MMPFIYCFLPTHQGQMQRAECWVHWGQNFVVSLQGMVLLMNVRNWKGIDASNHLLKLSWGLGEGF